MDNKYEFTYGGLCKDWLMEVNLTSIANNVEEAKSYLDNSFHMLMFEDRIILVCGEGKIIYTDENNKCTLSKINIMDKLKEDVDSGEITESQMIKQISSSAKPEAYSGLKSIYTKVLSTLDDEVTESTIYLIDFDTLDEERTLKELQGLNNRVAIYFEGRSAGFIDPIKNKSFLKHFISPAYETDEY